MRVSSTWRWWARRAVEVMNVEVEVERVYMLRRNVLMGKRIESREEEDAVVIVVGGLELITYLDMQWLMKAGGFDSSICCKMCP